MTRKYAFANIFAAVVVVVGGHLVSRVLFRLGARLRGAS
jgi:hypothetical protein